MAATFDVIVIGAGSAGGVVAARPRKRILPLEAGLDFDPWSVMHA